VPVQGSPEVGYRMRARLHVLSDIPDQWRETSRRWMRMNEQLRRTCCGTRVPAPLTELFIYQTILGVWPLQNADHDELLERISQFIVKALREAKESTSWLETDEAYESAVIDFVRDLLDADRSAEFLDDFHAFRAPLEWFGAINSLAQVVLKIASPGVPDTYRGTELWDFRLVDPDNRIAVNFDARRDLLDNLPEIDGSDRSLDHLAELMKSWRDGRIKLHTLHRSLGARQKSPTLFTHGEYMPLPVTGERSHNLCAGPRFHDTHCTFALAATHLAKFASPELFPLDEDAWGSTRIVLPEHAPIDWHDELTGARRHSSDELRNRTLRVAKTLQYHPVALFSGRT
jgi:(1->4)-alpha-D-glucan 1-alpha-D-glucosylmutase